ncbi:MAG: hypothetical protein GJV46_10080 [Geobacter sp.]|nr:hypothetical protein [Geobacter sp.]
MIIHFHHAEASVYAADIADIADLLQIPKNLFKHYQHKNGTSIYTYAVPDSGAKESVVIRIPESTAAAGMVKLHGSYFDSAEQFPMHKLRDYVSSHNGNIYHLDISYVDDEGHLDADEIKRMSLLENYKAYLTGVCTTSRKKSTGSKVDSNSRGGIPDVHANFNLIHYGNASGNYVKFYQQIGKHAKFELTLRDKVYIKLLLEKYQPDSIAAFETLSKSALVKHLNFITPASKRAKRPVQIDSYRNFLGSETKPVNWTEHKPAKDLAGEDFTAGLSRAIAQLQNLFKKHRIYAGLEKDIYRLQTKALNAFSDTRLDIDLDWSLTAELDFDSATVSLYSIG